MAKKRVCGHCAYIYKEEKACIGGGIYKKGKCKPENNATRCPVYIEPSKLSRYATRRILENISGPGE